MTHGPIPDGLCVLHTCDSPPCVNPGHLFLGTHRDNVDDKVTKRRQALGVTHGSAKLGEADVRAVRAAASRGESQRSIARRLGITHVSVGRILRRRSWRHIESH